MTSCRDVHGFLSQVAGRAVTTPLPLPDLQRLSDAGLVRLVTADGYRALVAQLDTMASAHQALAEESTSRAGLAEELRREETHTQSVLFHLHGKDKQSSELAAEAKARSDLASVDRDLAARQQAFNELVATRTLVAGLTRCADGYVALTTGGAVQLRNLGLRLYRLGDAPFEAYVAEASRISQRLETLSAEGASYFGQVSPSLAEVDRSYLWAVSLGLAKVQPNVLEGAPRFFESWNSLGPLGHNTENRLMASEILFAVNRPIAASLPALGELVHDSHHAGVPKESALGVGAILLYGQRADGSFATDRLVGYLRETRSYESAALLAIINRPEAELATKFSSARALFGSWGYTPSEDTELAAAYLTSSEVSVEGLAAKLAIVARGLTTYLEYPLVAAAVLASVSTLEANETLNLLEQAYGVVGRRVSGMSQAEIVTLAVRLVEGIRNELVGALDPTAARPAAAPPVAPTPRAFFLPIVVAHYGSYATFGGIGGAHPGHVHGFGGVGGGGFG